MFHRTGSSPCEQENCAHRVESHGLLPIVRCADLTCMSRRLAAMTVVSSGPTAEMYFAYVDHVTCPICLISSELPGAASARLPPGGDSREVASAAPKLCRPELRELARAGSTRRGSVFSPASSSARLQTHEQMSSVG